MKKLLTLFALALVVVVSSCSQFDDTPIWDKLNEQEQTLNDHERRIAALEELCKQMNTNIQALKTLVEAFEKRDYVTDVLPISEDGEVVGYTISFASSDTITIYMGKDGEDGADGKDGYTPQIGVMKDTDGIYYWTIDGEWLLDDNGNKIKAVGEDGKDGQDGADGANGSNGNNGQNGQDGEDGADGKDGITPRLKIENDYWCVSYDEGTTWIELGKATGEDGKSIQIGDSFIDNISLGEKGLIFVLDGGLSFTIPYYEHLQLILVGPDSQVMEPNSTLDIHYVVRRVGTSNPVIVEVVSSADIKAKVIPETVPYEEKVTGVIQVNTGDKIDEYSKVIVFASDGLNVVMSSIRFEEAGLVVEENTTKHVPSEGGEIALEFLSNVECEAVIPEDAQDWISVVPATRAMEKQTITLKLEPNAGDSRTAEVQVKSTDGKLSLTYTISQETNSDYLLALEREALIAIYNALDGDNWINNENWCSDKPVSEWFGLYTHDDGTIRGFHLENNLLSGEMPDDLLKLKNLEFLNLRYNNISTIPTGISSLTKLTSLDLPFLANIPIDELYNLSEITTLGLCVSDENLPSTGIDLSRWENLDRATISANQDDCIPLPNDFSGLSNLRYLILNGFSGELSPTIGQCTGLCALVIQNGTVTGEIPSTIGNLKGLSQLFLNNNQFSGSIPGEIFSCPLTYIRLENNRLSGEIPEEFGNWLSSKQDSLMSTGSLFDCSLHHNNLSGVPESIQKHPMWKVVWPHIIAQNDINHKDILLPGSHLSGCDIDGSEINSDTDYAKYDYTVLWQIPPEKAVISTLLFNVYQMNNIYEKYKDSNVKFIYLGADWNTEEELRNFRNNYDVKWQTFNVNRNALRNLRINYGHSTSYMELQLDGGVRGNQVTIVDNSGNIVYSSVLDGENLDQLNSYLEKILGAGSDIYQSTDYSADGAVVTLQTATQGEGIDIVLMGDAYSDRQITDGTYEADMKLVYKNLFTEEPYKSFKDYFNVRYVNVVSATEGYKIGDTALDSYFGGGTLVGGDDSAVFNYALKAISEEQMDEALLIVVMNYDIYAGTCYMYYPDNTADFGNGVSVSYFPKGGDETTFAQLLHHEACGHGFAKLADEYAYEEYGAIPSGYASQIQEQQSSWGWWKNVDFTSDPTATRWSHFINDTRYANEGLGAYEGGLTYWTGVWRPTENSIMRHNTGGFNAPSREAIYYRIHKLAYGADWEYDYEEFVEWDARNRATAASRAMVYKPANYKPTHPPVMVNKSWKDAK